MKVSFFVTLIGFIFIFNGCTQEVKSVYIPYEKNTKKQKKAETTSKIQKQKLWTNSGIVKGDISFLSFDTKKSLWIYEVKGISTTNGKLAFARFYNAQKIGKLEDTIYAIIEEKKAKELYLVKKANIKKVTHPLKEDAKVLHVKKKKKLEKRTKQRKSPGIGVPKEEAISLD